MYPYKGPPIGFRGQGIEKEFIGNKVTVTQTDNMSIITSASFPPANNPGEIGYDIITEMPYYSNGSSWSAIGSGASNTIYTGDDTVTSNRIVDGGGNNISFPNFTEFGINNIVTPGQVGLVMSQNNFSGLGSAGVGIGYNVAPNVNYFNSILDPGFGGYQAQLGYADVPNGEINVCVGTSTNAAIQSTSQSFTYNETVIVDSKTLNPYGVPGQCTIDSHAIILPQAPVTDNGNTKLLARNTVNNCVEERTVASIIAANPTIYSADSSLAGNRIVTGAGNDLTFTGVGTLTESAVTNNITGTTTVAITTPSLTLVTAPLTNNTNTQILTRDTVSGNVEERTVASIIAANPTIYSADSSLAGNRIVTGAGNDLTLSNIGTLAIQATAVNLTTVPTLDNTQDGMIARNSITGTINRVAKTSIKPYDYIVDPVAGVGDFTTIEAAISAGGTNIFIRDGLYTPASSLTLPQNATLIGESTNGTVIDFQDGPIRLITASPTIYTTGTITLTNGSSIVTGAGTLWLANVLANDILVYNGVVMRIATVDSDTQVTLYQLYQGLTIAGLSYKMFTPNTCHLSTFTIMRSNATTGTIDLNGTISFSLTNLNLVRDGPLVGTEGINISNCCLGEIRNCNIAIQRSGIALNNSDTINIVGNGIWNCKDDGIIVQNTCRNINITNNLLSQAGQGIAFNAANLYEINVVGNIFTNLGRAIFTTNTVSARYVTFVANSCDANTEGILLQGTFDGMLINGNRIKNTTNTAINMGGCSNGVVTNNIIRTCGTYGIILNSTCVNSVVSNNNILGCTNFGINVRSPRNVVSNNNISGGGSHGIYCDSDDNVFNSNVCTSNGASGIALALPASTNMINGCRCTSNTSYGITISNALCTSNTVVGSNTLGNGLGGLNDSGTASNLSANI